MNQIHLLLVSLKQFLLSNPQYVVEHAEAVKDMNRRCVVIKLKAGGHKKVSSRTRLLSIEELNEIDIHQVNRQIQELIV